MADEFYLRPIFGVEDLGRSLVYYCDTLGFEKAWEFGEAAPIIAQVGRNGLDLILDAGSVIPRPAGRSVASMTLHAPEQLGSLHRQLADRGARIGQAPFEVSWQAGLYQLDVLDPDGNVLVFWGDAPE